jgi:hypothetical protein
LYFQRRLVGYGLVSCWISIIVHWDGVCCRTEQLYNNLASHSNNYEDYYLWTCEIKHCVREVSKCFHLHGRRHFFFCTLKMEVDSSKILVLTLQCQVSMNIIFNNITIVYILYLVLQRYKNAEVT